MLTNLSNELQGILSTGVYYIVTVYGTQMKFERVKIEGVKGISGCRVKRRFRGCQPLSVGFRSEFFHLYRPAI